MNKTTAIAFKVFAIYFLFVMLATLPSLGVQILRLSNKMGISPTELGLTFTVLLISIILPLIAIWLLWKTANSIAEEDVSENAETSCSCDFDKLFQYALQLMGFYFAVTALMRFPYLWIGMQQSSDRWMNSHYIVNLIMNTLKLMLGAFLIAKPVQWFHWFRKIGLKENG